MAKQLQLRRGTTVQNDAFTGAVGELTMDTDKNQLRVHDGVTQGGHIFGDTVVEWQVPTAGNNYTWYRKYRSGWVEQGGSEVSVAERATVPIALPIEMADTSYSAVAQNNTLNTAADAESTIGIEKTGTATVTLFAHYLNPNTVTASWQVCGMAA